MKKSEILKECRKILSSYNENEKLNNNHFNFMLSVFELHPEFEQKKELELIL